MYSDTRFGDLLKGLPRNFFNKAVAEHESDKHSKGFDSWDHLVAMIYVQLSGAAGLREIEAGFNGQSMHHYHLGSGDIKRSTLADANAKRSCEVFGTLCKEMLQQTHRQIRKELKSLLYLIDSTPISLKGLGYDNWTLQNHSHRTHGLKVHIMTAPNAAAPVYAQITAPNINDIDEGKKIPLEKGATYVFDKGYCDYNWWYEIQQNGSKFVTRLKKNAAITIVKQRPIAKNAQGIILEDAQVCFKNRKPRGGCINHYHGTKLRKIVVHRPDKKTPMIIATNDFKRSALAIAELYQQRWEIELFFKWLKQNLKIKKFLGRSENAVKIQIYTALIAYVLVRAYRKRHGITQSMKICMVMLRTGLFQRPQTEQKEARKRRRRRKEQQQLQGALPI